MCVDFNILCADFSILCVDFSILCADFNTHKDIYKTLIRHNYKENFTSVKQKKKISFDTLLNNSSYFLHDLEHIQNRRFCQMGAVKSTLTGGRIRTKKEKAILRRFKRILRIELMRLSKLNKKSFKSNVNGQI